MVLLSRSGRVIPPWGELEQSSVLLSFVVMLYQIISDLYFTHIFSCVVCCFFLDFLNLIDELRSAVISVMMLPLVPLPLEAEPPQHRRNHRQGLWMLLVHRNRPESVFKEISRLGKAKTGVPIQLEPLSLSIYIYISV